MSYEEIAQSMQLAEPELVTEDGAAAEISHLKRIIELAEDAMSVIGVKHEISVYIDSCYGSGRSLNLEEYEDQDGETVEIGEWISSSNRD